MNIFTGTILVTLLIFVIGYPALVYFFCKGIDKLRERQKRELKLAKKYSVSYAIASEEFLQMMVAWAAYRDFVQGRPIEKWHILDRFFTSMMYDNAWENEFAHKIFSDWTEVFKRNYFRFYVAYEKWFQMGVDDCEKGKPCYPLNDGIVSMTSVPEAENIMEGCYCVPFMDYETFLPNPIFIGNIACEMYEKGYKKRFYIERREEEGGE